MPYLSRVSSENNKLIFERVINQVLLDYGGPERCPWTRAIIEGTLLFTKGIYFNIFMWFLKMLKLKLVSCMNFEGVSLRAGHKAN